MLVGTVVNNGILYVDTANQYRSNMAVSYTHLTRLPKVITLSENPMTLIITRAARIDTGMDVPTIRDCLLYTSRCV